MNSGVLRVIVYSCFIKSCIDSMNLVGFFEVVEGKKNSKIAIEKKMVGKKKRERKDWKDVKRKLDV